LHCGFGVDRQEVIIKILRYLIGLAIQNEKCVLGYCLQKI
jgi:hypothetical protein